MISDPLQDRATLYVSGEMPAPERDAFDVVLAYRDDLRRHVRTLQEALAHAVAPSPSVAVAPPSDLKARLLANLGPAPAAPEPEALVVTDPVGRLEWVNAAFTDLCGYPLEELRGKKPGQLLQGADTDPAAVNRIREALRAKRACREALVNYHKDGHAYRADVHILPVLDDAGEPLYFVARERRLPD